MEKFPFAHAGGSAANWESLAKSCLSQLGEIPPQTNLGFLYTTDLLAVYLPDILAYFKQHVPVAHWIGTTGIGVCAAGQEYHDTPALVVMLGKFPENSFQVFSGITDELEHFRRLHISWEHYYQPLFGIVHGDPRNSRVPLLIALLAEHISEAFLVGGLTSSRGSFLQIADHLVEGGLSGVLFSKEISIVTRLTQGCSRLGERHEITECQQNVLIRLDGRPALDVFKEEIGEPIAEDLKRAAGYIFVGLAIPGSDTEDYLVRNLLGIDSEHKVLAISEVVRPGMHVFFTKRNGSTARQDMVRMLTSIKHLSPKGGLYHSCVGRGQFLFGENSQELKLIREILGDFPLVGFFGNGEIFYNRLYGYTGILTLFL